MDVYVLLTKLTADGARSLWHRPRHVAEVNEEIEQFGCQVVSQFATLGPYDFVTIIRAPDNRAVLRLAAMLGSRGTIDILSMPAVWVGDFLDDVGRGVGGADRSVPDDEGGPMP